MASKMAESIIYNLHNTPIKCLSSYSKNAHNSMFSVQHKNLKLITDF